jgi:polysaccharide biosynthesis protein PslH
MKLLFLTSRFPFPLEKGDKLRAYYLIRTLSKKYDIYLFAINENEITKAQYDALSPYCKEIKTSIINKTSSYISTIQNIVNTSIPFQAAYFHSLKSQTELNEFIQMHQPEIVFCHLLRMTEYIKNHSFKLSILDYMDAFSIGMKRFADSSSWYIKPFAFAESKRLRKYEMEIFDRFNIKIIISEQDKIAIQHPNKNDILVLPNGVDFTEYYPVELVKKYDLLFIGNMSYAPNINSVEYAAKKIIPKLKFQFPNIRFAIAGANPSKEVLKLANENIEVLGWVDNPRDIFGYAKVMIAPMHISIGLQNKILQAMAMKIPCVISELANNAIGAIDGEHLFVAKSEQEYLSKIEMLLVDESLRNNMASRAYDFVHTNFGWDKQLQPLTKLNG